MGHTGLAKWSYTKLASADVCPLWERPEARERSLGSAVHQLVDEFTVGRTRLGLVISGGVLVDCAGLLEKIQRIFDLDDSAYTEMSMMLEKFFLTSDPVYLKGKVWESEKTYFVDANLCSVDVDDNPYWEGTADLWYIEGDTLHVVDYKTDRALPSMGDLRYFNQVKSYAGLVYLCESMVCKSITLHLHFLRYGVERVMDIDPSEAIDHLSKLIDKAERIDASEKAVKPGEQCIDCVNICECAEHYKISEISLDTSTPEKAVHAAEKMCLYKGVVAQLTKSLKVAVSANGPLTLPDGSILDFWPTTSTYYPEAYGTINFLIDQGIPKKTIWEAIDLSKSNVESIIKAGTKPRSKERKALLESVQELGKEKISTRFAIKKPVIVEEEAEEELTE